MIDIYFLKKIKELFSQHVIMNNFMILQQDKKWKIT